MYGAGYAQTSKQTSTCCTSHTHPWMCAHAHALSLFQYKDVLKSQIKIRIQILLTGISITDDGGRDAAPPVKYSLQKSQI